MHHSLLAISALLVCAAVSLTSAFISSTPLRRVYAWWSVAVALYVLWLVYREPFLWVFGLAMAISLLVISSALAFSSPNSKRLMFFGYFFICTVLVGLSVQYRVTQLKNSSYTVANLSTLRHNTSGEISLPSPFAINEAIADTTDIFPANNPELDAIWHQPSLLREINYHSLPFSLTYQNRSYLLSSTSFNAADGSSLKLIQLQREK